MPFFSTRKARTVLFVVTAILAYMPNCDMEIFALGQTQFKAVYFMTGVMLYDWKEHLPDFSSRNLCIGASLLMIILETVYLTGHRWACYPIPYVAILAVPSCFAVLGQRIGPRFSSILTSLAGASYIIYLFHTTFEGFAKSFLRPLLEPMQTLQFPWALYTYVLKRFKVTRLLFGLQ